MDTYYHSSLGKMSKGPFPHDLRIRLNDHRIRWEPERLGYRMVLVSAPGIGGVEVGRRKGQHKFQRESWKKLVTRGKEAEDAYPRP